VWNFEFQEGESTLSAKLLAARFTGDWSMFNVGSCHFNRNQMGNPIDFFP